MTATIDEIAKGAIRAVDDIKDKAVAGERERIAALITVEPTAIPAPPDEFADFDTGYVIGRDAERSRILAIVITDPETT